MSTTTISALNIDVSTTAQPIWGLQVFQNFFNDHEVQSLRLVDTYPSAAVVMI